MTLVRVAGGPAVVVCTTCRRSDGALLAEALHTARVAVPDYAGVAVQEMPCLFACGDPCAVYLRAPARIGYVLGRFAPDAEAARAILDYAVLHAASEEGEVPYERWPEGVKGNFIARVPPDGFVAP